MTDSPLCWRLLLGLVLCTVLCTLPAREASAAPTCTATMTPLTFGSLDLVTNTGTVAGTASLTYTCTNDQYATRAVKLCFNIGDGSAAIDSSTSPHWNPRILRLNATNEMDFQLYQGAGPAIWGSASQVINDPYDLSITLPARALLGASTITTATAPVPLRGVISANQSDLAAGTYSSMFTGNHTALRYAVANTLGALPGECAAVTTDGGTFGFQVSATVLKSCLVEADPLNFGTVDGLVSATPRDASTSIRVTCSKSTGYNVLLTPTNNSTTGTGAMTGATGNPDLVPYGLFTNTARSTSWGNQAANDVSGTGTGLVQSYFVYGRVPGVPNVRPDTYKDTVRVNVTF